MKKLLLTLITLTCAHSLQSMEIEISKTPISLPQIYSYLAKILLPEIAKHIFSLQPGANEINRNLPIIKNLSPEALADPNHKDRDKAQPTLYLIALTYTRLRSQVGHCLIVEILKRNFLRENMLMCDMKGHDGETLLHRMTQYGLQTKYAKICLEVDGNHLSKALTAQNNENRTALHIAAKKDYVDLVTLLLDTAYDNHVKKFVEIRDINGQTAFDIATPRVKQVMLSYLQNNQ